MGFNKRMISQDNILTSIKNNTPLKQLFKGDAIIFLDNFSSEVYQLFIKGIPDVEIIKTLENKK